MSQQKQFVEKWIGYLNSIDHEMSVIAAQKLGKVTDDDNAADELIKSLTKRPDDIRIEATRSLGQMKATRAVPMLVRLLDDPNPMLASTAAEALGIIKDSSSVQPLIKVLEDYKSGRNRHNQLHGFDRGLFMAAVHALEQINTFEARQAVKKYHR